MLEIKIMTSRILTSLVAGSLLLTAAVQAQSVGRPLAIEDYYRLKTVGGPQISPDGKWIVFRSDRHKPDHLQIFVIGAGGKNETQLTDTNGVNWGPYWHPTEPYLIWSGADHSNPNARPNYDLWLAKYTVEGEKFSIGEPARVTDFAGADVLPVFSPDGQKLMWTSTRTEDHSSQLFLADFKLPK